MGFEIKKTIVQVAPDIDVENHSFQVLTRQQDLTFSLNGGYESIVLICVSGRTFEFTNYCHCFKVYPTIAEALKGHPLCVESFLVEIKAHYPNVSVFSEVVIDPLA